MPSVAIHPGATIFVTGVNGLVGSHVADQLLKKGYNVRGAVRDVEKCKWLSEYFEGQYKNAKFELVAVPDMTVEGCYDEVVKGTEGFAHVAAPMSGNADFVIPTAVKAGLNALKTCAKTPSIKRVVLTSSSIASTMPSLGVEKVLDQTSYNEEGLAAGLKHPEGEPEEKKGLFAYAAQKTATEKACWKWVEERKPGFVFNTVLPNCNFGTVLVPEKQGWPTTVGWCKEVFEGSQRFGFLSHALEPQWFISNQDCALLHVAALISSDVSSERIYGFAQLWNFNDILAILRKAYPDRKFVEDIQGLVEDGAKPPRERAEEILKWVKNGGEGWDSLEKSIKEWASQYVKQA